MNTAKKDIPTTGFDWPAIITYLLFAVSGLACIYAAIYSPAHPDLLDLEVSHGKQLLYIGISVLLGFVILLSDYEIYPAFAYIFYTIIIALCVLVIFVSPDIKGAHSWFQLGGFRFQPSEFGKFATALCLARYLSGYDVKFKDRRTQLICAGIIGLPMIVTLAQNDTGSALVYLSFILVLYREGLPGFLLVFGLIAIASAILGLIVDIIVFWIVISIIATLIVILFFFIFRRQYTIIYFTIAVWAIAAASSGASKLLVDNVLQAHQRQRIMVTLGLEIDLKGAGYNVHQSKIAIGSGGFWGKGWLQGTQTKGDFVPEQSTDFIFCTVGEEWGFVGCFLVVGSFVWFLYRLVVIAERQRNKFNRVYAYSVASILFFHFVINIGMTLGLLPVIGIPLPLFSYGGSSMLGFTILIFIMLKLDSNRVNELQSVID